MAGSRIVIVSETERGQHLQESLLKQASGNDWIVARSIFKAESQFRPDPAYRLTTGSVSAISNSKFLCARRRRCSTPKAVSP